MAVIPKLYMDASVFNFYFYEKRPREMADTHKIFHLIKAGRYEAYTSEYAVEELEKAAKEKYQKMLVLVEKYTQKPFSRDAETERLAGIYLDKKIIPVKYIEDAQHIASATVNGLDFVVSYNFGHIVKLKTMIGTGFANLREGYRQVGITTPEEVLEYDTERNT
jgi:predicted nucleic acid-binding protein